MIAVIAPYAQLETMARELTSGCKDVVVVPGYLSEGVRVARKLKDKGAEVFVTRGGTVDALYNSGLSVPVVEIPVTGYDIIKAIYKAKQIDKRIGVVGFEKMLEDIGLLSEVLDVELRVRRLESEQEIREKLRLTALEGVKVVVGGVVTVRHAGEFGMEGVLVETGRDAVWQAINEARRIIGIRHELKAKTRQFQIVLEHINEGVIATNKYNEITFFNNAAEQLMGIHADKAIGEKVTHVIRELNSELDKPGAARKSGSTQLINHKKTFLTMVPVNIEGEYLGSVITLQDVSRIQENEERIREEIYLKGYYAPHTFDDILTASRNMKDIISLAKKYSKTSSTILITGESGTGKEMFAQSIHNASDRRDHPFVAINCAAFPENLLESELFGYEEGAFTGARKGGKAGLFSQAHKGTIFLDEIGEIPQSFQLKLLRVLQEKSVRLLGGDRTIPVDVRVIAATNKELKKAVENGEFRRDLYYRLNVLHLHIPAVRERREDIELLLNWFLKEFSSKQIEFTPEARDMLKSYGWPGNVREIINAAERIAAVSAGKFTGEMLRRVLEIQETGDYSLPASGSMKQVEKQVILNTIKLCNGNKSEAARRLGISRTHLWRVMNRQPE